MLTQRIQRTKEKFRNDYFNKNKNYNVRSLVDMSKFSSYHSFFRTDINIMCYLSDILLHKTMDDKFTYNFIDDKKLLFCTLKLLVEKFGTA